MNVSMRYSMGIKIREAIRCNAAKRFPKILSRVGCSPIFATLRLTRRCSSKCKTCNLWMKREHGELTTSEWKHVISSLREQGFLRVDFSGGDILLRNDLLELIRFSTDCGQRASCSLNGYRIDEKTATSLMELKLSGIFVSLDDMSSDFSKNRGMADAVEKVKCSIELLKRYDNKFTRIGIAATIMKYTIDSIPHITQYAIDNDLALFFNLIHFTHYFSDTPFSSEQYKLTAKDSERLLARLQWLEKMYYSFPDTVPKPLYLSWIKKYFRDYQQRETPCYKPMLKICVEPNGDVRSCCSMKPVGNIKEKKLGSIIRSGAFAENAQKGIRKECPGCSCHYTMNLDFNAAERLRNFFLRYKVGEGQEK